MRDFAFAKADGLDAALTTLGRDGTWQVLAGGTTMVDLMKLNVAKPDGLVDITSVEGLDGIAIDSGAIRLGALARMSDIGDHDELANVCPALTESLWLAASPQLRHAARLAGNILQRTRCPYFRDTDYACNKREAGSGCAALDEGHAAMHAVLGGSDDCVAMYPGDWGQALIAFDADVGVRSKNATRRIPFAELHTQPGATPDVETTLKPGEIITEIRVPRSPAMAASTYLKARDRASYAFASASAAVGLAMDGDTVADARIALGGVASVPWRAREAEDALKGKPFSEEAARDAGRIAFRDAKPVKQSAYKIPLGQSVVAGALVAARKRAS